MATKMDVEPISSDRRITGLVGGIQLATVNRVARLLAPKDMGLSRMHRISDTGAELSSTMQLAVGQAVQLDLSETVSLDAEVSMGLGGRYGLIFRQSIHPALLLRDLVQEARSARARPLRLATGRMKAIGKCTDGNRPLEVRDISQRGMKVRHDGEFRPGLRVCIQLPNGRECRGIVRWTNESCAGLLLDEILSANELGSVCALQGGDTPP